MREITEQTVKKALDEAACQVRRNLPSFTYQCQNHSSVNNWYPAVENNQWTCGFWPGEVCLAYEHTQDPVFLHAAHILSESFLSRIERKIEVDHHDMGFLYTPSCVSLYKLDTSLRARKAALLAADQLLTRFQEKGSFLQAWGPMGARENYRFIIDCLMNLPLLYWASEQTGDGTYRSIALRHTQTCLANSFRPDGSTFHTFFMDPVTGEPVRGETCQGYRADSSWARGQAWGIYGLAMSYRYTADSVCVAQFRKAAAYYLSKLPSDLIPYWDLIFTEGDEPRDSSSASIVACGFLEMASLLDDEKEAQFYIAWAKALMQSLYDSYRVTDPGLSNGLVLHGTYSKKSPYNTCTPEGVDECVSWGDYFYMEALTRLGGDWVSYW
ncbi:glycoside hydrolase family 88 protein [Sphaerochaeta globosa]|uniref:Glycosyl hydrolase family 88 n=1 Tax=Sphaerochaeta globosa (strain ATCC BAA-1886 / DSM 22777 / Buddy) TaxID=158189 RepID=F0RV37_SPHGB|nr:glycoside hydrolase family 88 protein [Sphaerochaeta globosa]ADY12688.1 glycosyl hydrolase family 88 [Sphaerochaeta globosa str. Buddy]